MKKVLSIILAMLLICSTGTLAFTSSAASTVASGKSKYVTWSLDSNGKMTLSGSGSMADYTDTSRPPWESYKSRIKTLSIGSGVTNIGNFAFYKYTALTGSLTIPNSVKSIGGCAFDGCTGFNGTLSLGTGITSISTGAFRDCMFTGNLKIPDSVTTMDSCVFQHCCGFDGTLHLGSGLKEIPYAAFSGCSKLTGNIVIPNTVKEISAYAFRDCSGFHGTLSLGSSVETIGECAFYQCSGLTGDLMIPNSVTEIIGAAFAGCSGFDGRLKLSSNLVKLTETSASTMGAFAGCSNLKGDLVLPETLTTIGKNAFLNCYSLSGTLVIPESVTYLGVHPFHACARDTDIIKFFENYPDLITVSEGVLSNPSCDQTGQRRISVSCAACNMELLNQTEDIPAKHTLVSFPQTEPADGRDGTIAHYNCVLCDKYFLDADGTHEISIDDLAIHSPDAPKQENTKLESADQPASFDLVTRCKTHQTFELDRKTVTLTMHSEKEATIEENGNVKYYTDADGTKYVYDESKRLFVETQDVSTQYPVIPVEQLDTIDGLYMPSTQPYQLDVKVLPENATFRDVTFASADPAIVTVDKTGLITPISIGITSVTCEAGGVSKTIKVEVFHGHGELKREYINIETEPTCTDHGYGELVDRCVECGEIVARHGKMEIPATGIHLTELVPTLEPSEEKDGYIEHYICTSCDGLFLDEEVKQPTSAEEIALHFADKPKIEHSKPESESQPATFELVTYCKHDETELDRKTVTLEMHPAVEASLLGDGNVKYYTDDDGNKYVYDEEKATFEATENVTVQFVPITVEKLNVNEAELHLVIGDTFQLETTTEPANATFPQVIFTSSDESVAEVNPLGLVTGKAEGMATIECRTGDGATATVTVTVKHKHVSGEPRIENISKQPTCAETGSGDLVTRCIVCAEELAREMGVEIPATGKHTPDGGHKEKEVKATCETEGSYVLVICCKDCGKELSAETVNIGYADHDWNDGEVKSGKYDKYTVTDYTCQHCGQHKTEQTRNPDYQFRCKQCDWYDARRNTKGVLGLIYKMIHDITHMVQHINFLT